MSWEALVVTFALVDNVLLSRLMGTVATEESPLSTRAGLSLAVTIGVLLAVASVAAWAVDTLVMLPLGAGFLRLPAFLFIVGGLAWLLSEGSRRAGLAAPGLSFPEAAVNSAALGTVLVIRGAGYSAGEGLVAGLAAGVGYGVVHVILAGIHRRLDVERVPRLMRGLPLRLVTAGLLAYAFLAFDRAFLSRALGG